MPHVFDYTDTARRFVARSPMLSYVGIQITFWILANNLMGLIIHFHSVLIARIYHLPIEGRLIPIILTATLLGIVYGVTLGTITYQLEKTYYRKQSLRRILVVRLLISIIFGLIVFSIILMISSKLKVAFLLPVTWIPFPAKTWLYSFYIFMLFYCIMSVLIGFINLMNKKYGPGVLIPLILGKYRNPVEEERIFVLMDLQSSTSIAEKLGHITYSAFIRECFWDINLILAGYSAEIYQYAGDEIILTWKVRNGVGDRDCVQFFFSCEQKFLERSDYYNTIYGVIPKFKAGIHAGMIVAVEVGDIKREIAYYGDTINTAARIQALCNGYNKTLLVSESLLERIGLADYFKTEPLGHIQLKGKLTETRIFSVER